VSVGPHLLRPRFTESLAFVNIRDEALDKRCDKVFAERSEKRRVQTGNNAWH
jgi:hypothetical protein